MLRQFLAASFIAAASPVLADSWHHAESTMDQREGGLSLDGGSIGISYFCMSNTSSVTFFAQGLHVASGESVISVDGRRFSGGNTQYNSRPDTTSFTASVQSSWGRDQKSEFNTLLKALAGGSVVVWTTPSGESFEMTLKGSGPIRHCVID